MLQILASTSVGSLPRSSVTFRASSVLKLMRFSERSFFKSASLLSVMGRRGERGDTGEV